jgi:hypothetical protein
MRNNRTPGFYRAPLVSPLALAVTWFVSLVVIAQSSKSEAPAATAASASTAPRFDCCSLLTAQEIEDVQRSPIKDKKNSERANGGLLMTQCVFIAADFPQSVSLAISHTDPSDAAKRSVTAYWKETFGRYSEPEEARERDKRSSGSAKEEKEGVPPKKIEGIGDDAYWLADRVGGALYVLKKDAILRLSLGGKQTEETRLEKSKALAQKALARL